MKPQASHFLTILLAAGLMVLSASSALAQSTSPLSAKPLTATGDQGWPRSFTSGATSFANYNPQTGVISAGAGGGAYNAATGEVTAGGRSFVYNTKTDTGVAVGKNNVYAGKDGEVYRYNKADGWQQHTSDGWSSVSRPTDTQHIQNQQAARATGQQRWENFRSSGSPRFGSEGPRAGSGGPRLGSGSGSRFGRRR